MLKVWGRRSSFNQQKVMWLVGELQLPHEHIQAGGSFGRLDDPTFLAMTPHGRVPVIDDDGTIVWESHTILRYLRGQVRPGWVLVRRPGRAFRVRTLDGLVTNNPPAGLPDGRILGLQPNPRAATELAAIQAKVAACARHFRLLDRIIGDRRYLCGDSLALADIPVGTSLYRYFQIEIERPSVPNVERWYRRLQEHPAYQEHVMVPFSELFGRLDY